jgi:NADPH-dependent ferric siderophore reductase
MAPLEDRFPRRAGVATLVARTPLTPLMIRVTLRCDGFGAGWPIQQPGEIITLLFVAPGEPIVLPVRGWTFPAGAPAQEWRNYTVRRHRPRRGEVDVDVVLHRPRGPACTWAAEAPIGSPVGYAGPRVDYAPRDGVDWLLLCGDETALPAIAAILEAPPAAPSVLAVVEVPDAGEELAIDLPPGGRVQWVHRDGAPAATTSHLADALRALALPAGTGQAWGAAESRIARDLRWVLRDGHGLPRTHAHAKGYWLRSGEWDLDDE